MDNTILISIIGALGTIFAAAVGGIVGRSEFWDRHFSKRNVPKLSGTRWESTWTEGADGKTITRRELLVFTHEKGGRIMGYISMDNLPDLKWKIEGDYNDRFLRLFWQPAPDAQNKFFLNSGCYFFERKGTGAFVGYAVGYNHETDQIEVGDHTLRQLAN